MVVSICRLSDPDLVQIASSLGPHYQILSISIFSPEHSGDIFDCLHINHKFQVFICTRILSRFHMLDVVFILWGSQYIVYI